MGKEEVSSNGQKAYTEKFEQDGQAGARYNFKLPSPVNKQDADKKYGNADEETRLPPEGKYQFPRFQVQLQKEE